MKRLFALILAVVMVLGLFACAPAPSTNNNNNDSNNNSNNNNNNDVVLPDDDASYVSSVFPLSEKQTLTVMINAFDGIDDLNQCLAANVLWQEILREYNVEVVFQHWNNDNVASLFQAGKMGDLIINGGSGNDTLFQGFIADNQLLPIEQYVNDITVMPNANRYMFKELPEARGTFTAADGHIYCMGSYSSDLSGYVENYMFINKAWLDKAELPVPTTFEELERALYYFATHDMNENDKDDEIPLWASNPANFGIETLLAMWGVPTKDGTYENYVVLDGDTVKFVPQMDIWKDFIKKMNEWFEAGILYEGVFTDQTATAKEKWDVGLSGDVRCGVLCVKDASLLRGSEEYVCLTPPKAPANTGDVRWYIHPGFMGKKNTFSVPVNSTNPKLACAFMDLFYSPEYTIRLLHGEADSIWRTTAADGTFTVNSPDVSAQEDVKYTAGNCLDKVTGATINFPTARGEEYYALYKDSVASEGLLKALKQYQDAGVINDNVWPRPYFTEDGNTALKELRTDIFKLVDKKRAEWIYGEADIDEEWDDFQSDLETARIDEFLEAMQEAYDVWKAGVDKNTN